MDLLRVSIFSCERVRDDRMVMVPSCSALLLLMVVVLLASSYSTSAHALGKDVAGQLPQIANGYIGTFVNGSDEYVSGVFNGATTTSKRAAFPATTRVFLSCAVDRVISEPHPFEQLIETASVFLNGKCLDGSIAYSHRWYAHRSRRNLLVLDIDMTNSPRSAPVVVSLTEIPPPFPSGFNQIKFLNTTVTADGAINVTVYSTLAAEVPGVSSVAIVAIARAQFPSRVTVLPSETAYVRIVTARVTTLEVQSNIVSAAESLIRSALKKTANGLYEEHLDAWSNEFKYRMATDSPSVDDVLVASQYAILSSMREDWPMSTSPGGLVTDGYGGHTFWDMETWMLPSILLFHPAVGLGSALKYRLDRLPGAIANARETLKVPSGAAFPWESAFTGYDVCPWPQGAKSELHVTPDVIAAIRMHYYLSKNVSFLDEYWPVLNETANFWVARCTFLRDGSVHLNGVTPPDEYHFGNDSTYTNALVKLTAEFTLNVAKLLKKPFQKNFLLWEQIAKNITVLYDKKNDYHPEFLKYKGDQVKQADVVLLNFPVGMEMPSHTAASDLAYYWNRTDPRGPAMTWSMFAVGFLSVGDADSGMKSFYRGFQDNCFPPYFQWYEVAGGGGCPNFVTGAGGFLQSVWGGLAALRILPDSLSINPKAVAVPHDASFVDLNGVSFLGSRLRLKYIRAQQINTTLLLIVEVLEEVSPLAANGKRIPTKGSGTGPLQFNLTAMAAVGAQLSIQPYHGALH